MLLRVERHDNVVEHIEVTDFTEEDAKRVAEQMNSHDVLGIAIGDQVFSRILIKHVKVVDEMEKVPSE